MQERNGSDLIFGNWLGVAAAPVSIGGDRHRRVDGHLRSASG